MLDAVPDDDDISITLDFLQDEVDFESENESIGSQETDTEVSMFIHLLAPKFACLRVNLPGCLLACLLACLPVSLLVC